MACAVHTAVRFHLNRTSDRTGSPSTTRVYVSASISRSAVGDGRQLDQRIRALSSEPIGDQIEIARLKRRKLMLKDRIQLIIDSTIPDIIA